MASRGDGAPGRRLRSPLDADARTDLQRHDLSAAGREVIQVRVDLAPRTVFGRHRHPGEETIYVLEGTFEYQVEGKPPVTLRAGEVLFIPAGTIHAARNVGRDNAAELATYIVGRASHWSSWSTEHPRTIWLSTPG